MLKGREQEQRRSRKGQVEGSAIEQRRRKEKAVGNGAKTEIKFVY